MKKLTHRMRKILRSRTGETLSESLVSLLVLTLLSLAAAALILTAMKITGEALNKAQGSQGEINSIIENVSGVPDSITFSSDDGISARHGVILYNRNGIIAFAPLE